MMTLPKPPTTIFIALGVCILFWGCTSSADNEKLPSISLTPTQLLETVEPIRENPLPTTTVTASSERPECSSIKVEDELPEPNVPENYIGKTFDSLALPAGLEFISGNLISDSNFALVQVSILETDTQVLWLVELKCHKDYVHDILVLPVVKKNQEFVVRYCRVDGQEDPEVLAIGEFKFGTIPLTKIEYVWRANRETKKFETLLPEGIKCWRDIGITSP